MKTPPEKRPDMAETDRDGYEDEQDAYIAKTQKAKVEYPELRQ